MYFITTKRMLEVCFFQHTPTFIIEPYFGLGTKLLRRMAEENAGGFAIVIGNRYMIVRNRFENYLITLTNKIQSDDMW